MKIFKPFLVIILLFVFVIPSLWAVGEQSLYHIIAYYSFDIKGKSSEKQIREMIVPPQGDAPFVSIEEMEKSLESKRNQLNNMRLFEEVSYTYEAVHADDTAIRYRVKFFIDDAFSFLAIPYPKYDSNFGFRLGLKAYDKNLFGSFADLYLVVNTTQIEGSWQDYEWFSELTIDNIPVAEGNIDLGAEIEAIQEGSILKDVMYKANIDWTGIPLAQTTFDIHVDVDENAETEEDEFDKLLTASLQWDDLPWFNSALRVRPAFQFKQSGNDQPWDVDNASFHSSVTPIRINGEEYVFANTIKLKFPHEYVQSTTSLTLAEAYLFGMPLSFWVSANNFFHMDNQEFYDNTYAVGGSLGFSLPFRTSYKGSYEVSLRDGFNKFGENFTAIEHVPYFSTTQTVSFGAVNWEGNFRKGLKGALWGKADYALFSREWKNFNYLNYRAQAEVETFLKLGNRIGLSARGMGFYSHVPSFDWYENQSFPTFLPNSSTSAPEKLRGILDDTYEEIVGEYDYQKLGAVANIDATLMFIKFKGFAEGFMSAFMDIGVFTNTVDTSSGSNSLSRDDLIVLKTIGVEGYGIMDKFPSYPIRGSLGFNLDDVMDHLEGNLAFSEIEFELSIGMGLHY